MKVTAWEPNDAMDDPSTTRRIPLRKRFFPTGLSDVVVCPKPDRRALPNAPREEEVLKSASDRRGETRYHRRRVRRRAMNPTLPEHQGMRYMVRNMVHVSCRIRGRNKRFVAMSEDISTSGMSLRVPNFEGRKALDSASRIKLRFRLHPGDLPEGYEMKVKINAKRVRLQQQEDGSFLFGLLFERSLINYAYTHKGRRLRLAATLMFMLLVPLVVLSRADAPLYFTFSKPAYIYGLITASFLLSRYLFGALYKPVPVDKSFTPGVSIIVPCYNEETWIPQTILGCLNQNYPQENLEVIVVDDCSRDRSPERIEELLDELYREEKYNIRDRLHFVHQEHNLGKRAAIVRGARMAKHDLLVFVDSDSLLDSNAIINLVQPFRDPRMGGVTGRTDVANTYTNLATKMQSVRYYVSFRIMKAAEAYFDAVTCLSGPLSCYRKDIVLDYAEDWLDQKFLGVRATFGDDRAMTNFVLRKYRTSYQDTAICSTIVPNTHRMFLKQQIRWKRSWLRESTKAATFMWRKEPMMAVSFYIGFIIPILSPLVVLYNLAYVPIVFGFFPRTFLIGLLVMALLMAMTQMMMRRSSTWWYAIIFCAYYLLVLMWQMPYAWLTFWRSNWGTRETAEDIASDNVMIVRNMDGVSA